MLKLKASFAKKVPAELEYSSKSFHAEVEVELPEGLTKEQLDQRIQETFSLVENSVEFEINKGGNQQSNYNAPQAPQAAPQSNYSKPNNNNSNGYSKGYKKNNYSNNQPRAASAKQINYLSQLLDTMGVTEQQVISQEGIQSLNQLQSKRCSEIIDEVKQLNAA